MEREKFSLDEFKKRLNAMILTNSGEYGYQREKIKEYTREEIEYIINNGSLQQKIKLSEDYFARDGFYRRILIYYATLLKYNGILIPNPKSQSKKLSDSYISKKYFSAIDFLDKVSVSALCSTFALKVLTEGTYYGYLTAQPEKKTFYVLDLPAAYCRTLYKDIFGNDIVEFNTHYFDSIPKQKDRKTTLRAYPKEITDWYHKYKAGKVDTSWVLLSPDSGICFQLFDSTPLFLTMLPSVMDYDEAVKTEKERDKEEIKKIIVQKIPHLTDGTLLFEPDEVEVMHAGTVGMLRGNKNVSVLTTYGDVDAIVSKTAADTASNNLEKMVNNIYYQSGTSGQLFASNGNLALSTSIKNDAALMMVLAHKFESFITSLINRLFSNANIDFKFLILPVTHYNAEDYAKQAYEMANGGYSFLVPAIAMDLSQKDLVNIKSLENELLKLDEKLKPLQLSYTQSSNDVGAPEKAPEEKTPKTVSNEKSIDKTGEGGSN